MIGLVGFIISYRMDVYVLKLMDLGLKGMIGKGVRNKEVIEFIKKNKVVYFGVIGGVVVLIGKSIIKFEIIVYEDLGVEVIRKMEVKDMFLVVIIDFKGDNFYELG